MTTDFRQHALPSVAHRMRRPIGLLVGLSCLLAIATYVTPTASAATGDVRWAGRVALDASHWRLHADGRLETGDASLQLGFRPSRVGVTACADNVGAWLAIPTGLGAGGPAFVQLVQHRRGTEAKLGPVLMLATPAVARPTVARDATGSCRWVVATTSGNVWLWVPGGPAHRLATVVAATDPAEVLRGHMTASTASWVVVADGHQTVHAWSLRGGLHQVVQVNSMPQPGIVWHRETLWWISRAGHLHRWTLPTNQHVIVHRGPVAVRTGLTPWADPDGVPRRVAWADLAGGIWSFRSGVTTQIGMAGAGILWPLIAAPVGLSNDHVLLAVVQDGSTLQVSGATPMLVPNAYRATAAVGLDEDLLLRPMLAIPQGLEGKRLPLSSDESRAATSFAQGSAPWSGQQVRGGILRDSARVEFAEVIKAPTVHQGKLRTAAQHHAPDANSRPSGAGCTAGPGLNVPGEAPYSALAVLLAACCATVRTRRRGYRNP